MNNNSCEFNLPWTKEGLILLVVKIDTVVFESVIFVCHKEIILIKATWHDTMLSSKTLHNNQALSNVQSTTQLPNLSTLLLHVFWPGSKVKEIPRNKTEERNYFNRSRFGRRQYLRRLLKTQRRLPVNGQIKPKKIPKGYHGRHRKCRNFLKSWLFWFCFVFIFLCCTLNQGKSKQKIPTLEGGCLFSHPD